MRRTDNGVGAAVKRRYVLGFIAVYVLGSIAILVLLLISPKLTRARYVDVSDRSPYAERLGQRCTVLKGLRAHGYTLDLRRKDLTHEVVVTVLPGIGGPEITFKVPLPKGITLVITAARKCWICLPPS